MKIKKIIPLLFIFALPLLFSCNDEDAMNKVTGVVLNKTDVTLVVGDSEALTAIVEPSGTINKKVGWMSGDQAIATVDSDGNVTARSAGQTTITVTTEDGNKTAICIITVVTSKVPVTGLSFDETSFVLAIGEIITLEPIIAPINATNKNIKWVSSDNAVAMVGSYGKVTPFKIGSATITATTEDGNKIATVDITVRPSVTGVTLNKDILLVRENESETLIATVIPAEATNKDVIWESSDESVATVDANGNVTGVKAGKAKIKVTTVDVGYVAECVVETMGPNSFADLRDNNVYYYVTIGTQTWMSGNLKYMPSVVPSATGSETEACYYVYGYQGTDVNEAKATENYEKYGVLYNWVAANGDIAPTDAVPSGIQGACPDGWHVPSEGEFFILTDYLSANGYNYDGTIGTGRAKVAKSMADPLGVWDGSGNTGAVGNSDFPPAQNKSGFSALPGGRKTNEGTFALRGSAAYFRTTSAWGTHDKQIMLHSTWADVRTEPIGVRKAGSSIRCVKD